MAAHKRIWGIVIALIILLAASAALVWLFGDLPSVTRLSERLNTPSVRIEDRYGRLLYEIIPEQGGRHTAIPLSSIPVALQQATIATEDSHFYQNPGVDLTGIVRAFWINLRGGETIAGGSTITQQVARNLLLDEAERAERSLRRKLRESLLAWLLARTYSKDEILALYLNETYYGGLAYGVEAAAQTYFGKPVSELDLAECALLAGLPQAPALYDPFTDFEAAKARQAVVLTLMESMSFITQEQRRQAEREPLVLAGTPYPMEAPHFVLMVRSQLDRIFTPEEIYQFGGLTVQTTLDLDWQRQAERAVDRQIEALLLSEDGLGHNVNSAAVVALNPYTGEILAMVGSPDYFDADNAGALNMALSPRQPGSSIKPLIYAAAFDPLRPHPWTAATMILDVQTSFTTQDGQAYIPENYDGQEHGPVLARQALASSLNIPAVVTLDQVGIEPFIQFARSLGISTLTEAETHDLPLALGAGHVRLIELTSAYAAFANGGYRITPVAIQSIADPQGNVVYTPQPITIVRVVDERVAWLISDILSDDTARILGFGAHSVLNIGRPAAVKTGTTTNFHDNWTIGYTPELVVGVWVGNTNYEPMWDVTGVTGAAPIWHEFMRTVLTGSPERSFIQPPGLVRVEVCALSGLLPTDACPYRQLEWFIEGTQPTLSDPFYQVVAIDRATGRLATQATPPERAQTITVLDLPPRAQPWARAQGLVLLSDLMGTASESAPPGEGHPQPALFMVSPSSGSIYQLSPSIPAANQRILLEATGTIDLQQVSLWMDGSQVAVFTTAPFQTWWVLEPGMHQVWAEGLTATGQVITSPIVSFEVRP